MKPQSFLPVVYHKCVSTWPLFFFSPYLLNKTDALLVSLADCPTIARHSHESSDPDKTSNHPACLGSPPWPGCWCHLPCTRLQQSDKAICVCLFSRWRSWDGWVWEKSQCLNLPRTWESESAGKFRQSVSAVHDCGLSSLFYLHFPLDIMKQHEKPTLYFMIFILHDLTIKWSRRFNKRNRWMVELHQIMKSGCSSRNEPLKNCKHPLFEACLLFLIVCQIDSMNWLPSFYFQDFRKAVDQGSVKMDNTCLLTNKLWILPLTHNLNINETMK